MGDVYSGEAKHSDFRNKIKKYVKNKYIIIIIINKDYELQLQLLLLLIIII